MLWLLRKSRLGLLFAAVAILAMVYAAPGIATVRFHHLNTENGLSNDEVYTIIQDRQGYIWIATQNGIDRYDGYTFKNFKHNPNDPRSLSGNFARALYQDPQGRIWVGTFSNGLDLYEPDTGGFKHYRHDPKNPDSIASDSIWSLNAGPNGTLLVGTFDRGLDVLDPKSGVFHHHPAGAGAYSPSNNRINSIYEDKEGRTWLGTLTGLDLFDPAEKQPTLRFKTPAGGEDNNVWAIAEDNKQQLWLATQGGAYRYVPGDTTLTKVHQTSLANGPTTDLLHTVFVDSRQNVWYGSVDSGLYLLHAGTNHIRNYRHSPGSTESLSSNTVWDVFEDKSGLIWIATEAGISLLDPNILNIYSLKPSDIHGNSLSPSNFVAALCEYRGRLLIGAQGAIYQYPLDSKEDSLTNGNNIFSTLDLNHYSQISALYSDPELGLLVGTDLDYLLVLNPQGKVVKQWIPSDGLMLRKQPIHRILRRSDHELFLATFGDGLLDFNTQTSKVRQIHGNSPTELSSSEIVEDLLPIYNGKYPTKLWIATFHGLYQLDVYTDKSSLLSLTPGNIEPVIQGLYEDAGHNLWVATYEGLWRVKLDDHGDPVAPPEAIPQLRGSELLAIEQDAQGYLWLANVNELLKFNPANGTLLTFGRNQGSPIDVYYSYGHIRTSNDWLWFGGDEGVVGFLPRNIVPNRRPPGVVVDGVTTYGQGRANYTGLSSGSSLTLGYRDAISIFDVAATDFGAPQANTYSYRLLGFQSDWTPATRSHQITFTNLSPGRYRLEVKAANNWGTWSVQPAAMDIIVLPPWWRTWWAYTLYLLVIIGSSITYVYSLKRKIEREQEISTNLREANDIKSNFLEKLESQVRKATHELRETLQGVNLKNAELEVAQKRAAEAEQIKSQFLANMSHELRTPLTGVLGYTKLLGATHLNSEQKDYISTIKQSSETLLAIINDTLDLSRLEAGKLLIDQVDFDLLEVIESTLELLAPTAYQKRLELARIVPTDIPLYLRGDPLRLRQVLTNLLSNAIKFTEHGSVAIEVKTLAQDEREAKLLFTVSDTGIGIPASELPKLFHAYARSRISTQHHVEGTGLGLAICKKLLDLMGGDINVRSKVGTGTSFEFELVFKLQKNAEPRSRLPRKIKVLLYDAHPLSNQAWRACLTRLGAEVETAPNLESVVSFKADAAIMVLSEKELAQLGELKRSLTPVLPPMLILAPRIDRQALKDLSETLFHRVLSKTAREKTLYLELQSLLQTVVQDDGTLSRPSNSLVVPAADAPKILIADDNRINRRLLVTMLNHAGFRASEAANGLELLDLAAKDPWDAALIDIHMPGMDGIEAAKRLRESLGDALPPVIAMSADVMPETRKQVLEGIMDDFMVKPFSEQELVDKLRWHLDRYTRKKRGEI